MTEANKGKDKAAHLVLRPMRHSGQELVLGDSVELTTDEANELLQLGAVQALEKTKSGGKNTGTSEDDPK